MRRGIAELDGEGETVGGVVILRSGKNARETLAAVHARLDELKGSLPAGVEIITTYDRSQLIDRAVKNLSFKLLEEFIVVALVCGLFLWHLRSSLVAIVSLPIGVLIAFAVMRYQGINANIMSLGGIAIAIGAMVDAAVVMIENAHKKAEAWRHANPGQVLEGDEHWQVMTRAAQEVGPALFFCLLIITLSFIPVFTLEAQEGRLFGPLAFTKTYAMAAAARAIGDPGARADGLLDPRPAAGRDAQSAQPRADPAVSSGAGSGSGAPEVDHRGGAAGAGHHAVACLPVGRRVPATDGRGRPALHAFCAAGAVRAEGRAAATADRPDDPHGAGGRDGVRQGRARRVGHRSGAAGDVRDHHPFQTARAVACRDDPGETGRGAGPRRASAGADQHLDSADPQPHRHARHRHQESHRREDRRCQPGGGRPCQPAGGSRGQAGAGVSSALAERLVGGRYIDIDIDRRDAARWLNIADVQSIVASAIGGETVGEAVKGWRATRSACATRVNGAIPAGARATADPHPVGQPGYPRQCGTVRVSDGPPMLRSENARLAGWVYVDVRGRDIASVVADLRRAVAAEVSLLPGMSLSYSGQFEFLERANERLKLVVPATLLIIFVLLYLTFGRLDEALLIMLTLPFALTGGVWFLYLMGYNLSVATGVGFIALAGVAAEFGVIMLLYLKNAWTEQQQQRGFSTRRRCARPSVRARCSVCGPRQ